MGRNINSILKSASFSNPLSSCCWLVLWGKNGLNFWVCLHVLIYTKPIWHFPFFFFTSHSMSPELPHSFFTFSLPFVECPGGGKWLYFPRLQLLLFVVVTQTWQSLSPIHQQGNWKPCPPLARNSLFLKANCSCNTWIMAWWDFGLQLPVPFCHSQHKLCFHSLHHQPVPISMKELYVLSPAFPPSQSVCIVKGAFLISCFRLSLEISCSVFPSP